MEKNFNSLNEELETLRKRVVYLRKKYLEAMTEIKDLEKENENGREDLLDTIRVQDKENKFIMAILKMLLKSDEIETMRSSSEWNDDTKEYTVRPFFLR
jgi:kinesin family protein 3/17